MKVYVVETVVFDEYIPHINVINISSTFENAILFIKKSLADDKVRIESNSILQIVEEIIDSYHDEAKFINRLTAQKWIDNYEKLSEYEVEVEELSCYDLQN